MPACEQWCGRWTPAVLAHGKGREGKGREGKGREWKRREEDDERKQNRRVERVETKVSVGECGLKGSVGRTEPQ
jgi:hypothetical protein